MMSTTLATLIAFAIALFAGVGPGTCLAQTGNGTDNLAGAWLGKESSPNAK
jgi:hypothetical protein